MTEEAVTEVPISLDLGKVDAAYKWFKANERGMGGWAGIRYFVYSYEVKGLSVADLGKIPYSKREVPPMTWSLPPEYMVAYLRIGRGMTKAAAIKEVESVYIPALQKEVAPKPPAVEEVKELIEYRVFNDETYRLVGTFTFRSGAEACIAKAEVREGKVVEGLEHGTPAYGAYLRILKPPAVKTEEWKLRNAIADTVYGLAHGVKEEDIRKHLTRNPRAKYWFEPEDVDYILREAKREVAEPKLESVIEYDRQYSLEELRDMAKAKGLSASGSKKEIASRLIKAG